MDIALGHIAVWRVVVFIVQSCSSALLLWATARILLTNVHLDKRLTRLYFPLSKIHNTPISKFHKPLVDTRLFVSVVVESYFMSTR